MMCDIIDCKESSLSDWLISDGWVDTTKEEQEGDGS